MTKRDIQSYGYQKGDIYGLSKTEWEVDTDVNEDPNREALLDRSAETYLEWQAQKKQGADNQRRND